MNETSFAHAPQHGAIRSLLSLIWRLTDTPLRLRVVCVILLNLGMASLNSTAPLFFKDIVDWFTVRRGVALEVPLWLVGSYLAITVLARACGELRVLAYGGFEQRVQHRLFLFLFDHVHSLSLRYHLERKVGGLQQILFNGLMGYRFIANNFLMVILPFLVNAIFIGTVLLSYYPIAFVIIMLPMCALYIVSLFVGVERQRIVQRSANAGFEDAYARITDSYVNFETIKLFGGERIVREGIDEAVGRGQQNFVKYYFLRTLTGFAQSFALVLWLAGTITLATFYVMKGIMTIGDLVLVNSYTLQLWGPLNFLSQAYREIKIGQTNLERILSLLNEKSEIVERPDAMKFPTGAIDLRFEDVVFFYDPKRPILKGVSFSVPGGCTVAIAGASGAGKSTIARLAFRFCDVRSGRITVNGQPIEAFNLRSLRAGIAVIPQDITLLNDTIAHNIGIAREGCSASEIEEAARLAEIHDYIVSLPKGYETVVGERGLKLSGGQRQRVAIARAVLKRARVLIFDEATSALDSETEHAIQRNLRNTSAGMTTLIITHRLSTVVDADEIVVLSDGRIVERGPHKFLLSLKGLYAEMWQLQQDEQRNASATARIA
jgi:ATP-binding cassette, subfamily B, heavy metal transporter